MSDLPIYVLITPAWNEAEFIEKTVQSVVRQTTRPLRWVIVNDGSTDGTDEIVKRYTGLYEWIELVNLPLRAQRDFAGKVAAFNAGYFRVAALPYEVIGNLDADVSFDADYLAFLLSKFADDPRLGVAGTPYRETNPQHDERYKSPDHVSGACQLFRRKCFEEIEGYKPIKSGGIDLVALLSAQAKGWQTRRFDEKFCSHHRTVGSGDHSGTLKRALFRGRKDYLLGSHPAFEFFRSVNQMQCKPYVLGGFLMLVGYFWALLRRIERTMPKELIKIRQTDQLRRLKDAVCRPLRNCFAHNLRNHEPTQRTVPDVERG